MTPSQIKLHSTHMCSLDALNRIDALEQTKRGLIDVIASLRVSVTVLERDKAVLVDERDKAMEEVKVMKQTIHEALEEMSV